MTTTRQHPSHRGSDGRMLLGVVVSVLALGLVLAGLGHVALTRLGVLGDPGVTVIGTVDLVDRGTSANGCEGVGDYSDVAVGTPVTLTDGSTAVVDRAFLVRAIKDPSAQIEVGSKVKMPVKPSR